MPRKALTIDLAGSGIRFLRINGDHSTDELTPAQMVTALGVGIAITKRTVADQAARYALTTAQVRNGDYVYQTDTTTLYEVTDDTQLGNASGYTALATVTAAQISDATAAGRALLRAADVGTQRSTLGLGTLATQNGTFSGTHSGTSSGTNTGDQTIILTGAVTGSGTGSFSTTLADGAVTLAKMANMATAALLGRSTAGAGVPEVLTVAQARTLLAMDVANATTQALGTGSPQTLTATSNGTWIYTGTTANHTVKLPATFNTGILLGQKWRIINNASSTGLVTVQANGGTALAMIGRQQVAEFTCVSTASPGTASTVWVGHVYAAPRNSNASASGLSAHAEGDGGSASGGYSHAEGVRGTASGTGAHAEGVDATASGGYAHAEGSSTVASGSSAHAEGTATHAVGDAAHAEGYANFANGTGDHVEGESNYANGPYSHAEGYGTTTIAFGAHAEGFATHATGEGSHAEGANTAASGNFSHAEGDSTLAVGTGAHAEGQFSTADAAYSHAHGLSAKTRTVGGTAFALGSIDHVGDRQVERMVFRGLTSDNGSAFLWSGGSPSAGAFPLLNPGSSYVIRVLATAADGLGRMASFERRVTAWTDPGNNGLVEIKDQREMGTDYRHADLTDTSCDAVLDAGLLFLSATGQSGYSLGWVAYAEILEMETGTPPEPPMDLVAAPSSPGDIGLSWNAPLINPDGYLLERSDDEQSTWMELGDVGLVGGWNDGSFGSYTLHYYRLRSYTGAPRALSGYCAVASAYTLPDVPEAPPNFTATATGTASILLEWEGPTNGQPLASYYISRSDDGINFTVLTGLAGGNYSYEDTGLSGSTQYWYQIYANNYAGNGPQSDADATTDTA